MASHTRNANKNLGAIDIKSGAAAGNFSTFSLANNFEVPAASSEHISCRLARQQQQLKAASQPTLSRQQQHPSLRTAAQNQTRPKAASQPTLSRQHMSLRTAQQQAARPKAASQPQLSQHPQQQPPPPQQQQHMSLSPASQQRARPMPASQTQPQLAPSSPSRGGGGGTARSPSPPRRRGDTPSGGGGGGGTAMEPRRATAQRRRSRSAEHHGGKNELGNAAPPPPVNADEDRQGTSVGGRNTSTIDGGVSAAKKQLDAAEDTSPSRRTSLSQVGGGPGGRKTANQKHRERAFKAVSQRVAYQQEQREKRSEAEAEVEAEASRRRSLERRRSSSVRPQDGWSQEEGGSAGGRDSLSYSAGSLLDASLSLHSSSHASTLQNSAASMMLQNSAASMLEHSAASIFQGGSSIFQGSMGSASMGLKPTTLSPAVSGDSAALSSSVGARSGVSSSLSTPTTATVGRPPAFISDRPQRSIRHLPSLREATQGDSGNVLNFDGETHKDSGLGRRGSESGHDSLSSADCFFTRPLTSQNQSTNLAAGGGAGEGATTSIQSFATNGTDSVAANSRTGMLPGNKYGLSDANASGGSRKAWPEYIPPPSMAVIGLQRSAAPEEEAGAAAPTSSPKTTARRRHSHDGSDRDLVPRWQGRRHSHSGSTSSALQQAQSDDASSSSSGLAAAPGYATVRGAGASSLAHQQAPATQRSRGGGGGGGAAAAQHAAALLHRQPQRKDPEPLHGSLTSFHDSWNSWTNPEATTAVDVDDGGALGRAGRRRSSIGSGSGAAVEVARSKERAATKNGEQEVGGHGRRRRRSTSSLPAASSAPHRQPPPSARRSSAADAAAAAAAAKAAEVAAAGDLFASDAEHELDPDLAGALIAAALESDDFHDSLDSFSGSVYSAGSNCSDASTRSSSSLRSKGGRPSKLKAKKGGASRPKKTKSGGKKLGRILRGNHINTKKKQVRMKKVHGDDGNLPKSSDGQRRSLELATAASPKLSGSRDKWAHGLEGVMSARVPNAVAENPHRAVETTKQASSKPPSRGKGDAAPTTKSALAKVAPRTTSSNKKDKDRDGSKSKRWGMSSVKHSVSFIFGGGKSGASKALKSTASKRRSSVTEFDLDGTDEVVPNFGTERVRPLSNEADQHGLDCVHHPKRDSISTANSKTDSIFEKQVLSSIFGGGKSGASKVSKSTASKRRSSVTEFDLDGTNEVVPNFGTEHVRPLSNDVSGLDYARHAKQRESISAANNNGDGIVEKRVSALGHNKSNIGFAGGRLGSGPDLGRSGAVAPTPAAASRSKGGGTTDLSSAQAKSNQPQTKEWKSLQALQSTSAPQSRKQRWAAMAEMAQLSTLVLPPSSGHSRFTSSSGGSNMSESMPNLSGHHLISQASGGATTDVGGSASASSRFVNIAESSPNLSALATIVRERRKLRAAAQRPTHQTNVATAQTQRPPLANFHLKMGRAHFDRGDHSAAKRCLSRVITMHQERDDREETSSRGLVVGAPHPEVVQATRLLAAMAGLIESAGDRPSDEDDGESDSDSDATPKSSSRHWRFGDAHEADASGEVRRAADDDEDEDEGEKAQRRLSEEKRLPSGDEDDDEMSLVSRVSMDTEGVSAAPYLAPNRENNPPVQAHKNASAESDNAIAPASSDGPESGIDDSEILPKEFYASRDDLDMPSESFSAVSSASRSLASQGIGQTFGAQRRELMRKEAHGEDRIGKATAVSTSAGPVAAASDNVVPRSPTRCSAGTRDNSGIATTSDYIATDGTFLSDDGTNDRESYTATDDSVAGSSAVETISTGGPSAGKYLDEESGPNELDTRMHRQMPSPPPRPSFNSLGVNSSARSGLTPGVISHSTADKEESVIDRDYGEDGNNGGDSHASRPSATTANSGASPKCATHDLSSGSGSTNHGSDRSLDSYLTNVAEEIAMAASVASSRNQSAQGPSDENTAASSAGENEKEQRHQESPHDTLTELSPVHFGVAGKKQAGRAAQAAVKADHAACGSGMSARTPTGEDTGETSGSNGAYHSGKILKSDPVLLVTKKEGGRQRKYATITDNESVDFSRTNVTSHSRNFLKTDPVLMATKNGGGKGKQRTSIANSVPMDGDFSAFKQMAKTGKTQSMQAKCRIQLQAHDESPDVRRGGLRQEQLLPPLAPFQPDPMPIHEDEVDEQTQPKPRSILVRKGSMHSVMSDMIESTATSWKEKQGHSPSVSSKSRSVSWADRKKGGTPPLDDGDAVNIPPGQLMPEIAFLTDQSHTVNLKAANSTNQTLSQARKTVQGGDEAPPGVADEKMNSEQAKRLSENIQQLQSLRARRKGGDRAPDLQSSPTEGTERDGGIVDDDGGSDEATQQFQLGISYYQEQDYVNAKSCFLACLGTRFKMSKKCQDHDVCLTQERLGDAMVRLGEVEEAHWQYLQSLRGLQAHLGPESAHATRIMLSIGDLYFDSGCFARALKYYEKCLRYRMNLLGEDHEDVDEAVRRAVRVHRALARVASEKREHTMNLFHHREVLWLSRFASKRGGIMCNISVGTARGGLGIRTIMDAVAFDDDELEDDIADDKESEEVKFSYLEEARRLLKSESGNNGSDDSCVHVLSTIASIHQKKGEMENARKCLLEKQDFLKSKLPGNTFDIAETLLSLGMVCSSAGKHRMAVDHLAESADMFTRMEGKGSRKVAAVRRLLCSSCLGARDFPLALQHYRIYFETCSDETDRVEVLTVMGIIHCKRYDLHSAIDCFIEGLKIEATQSGGEQESNNDLAPMIENLNCIFRSPKKFKHGTYYCYEKARDSEDMKIILQNLGLAQMKRRNTSEAKRYLCDLVANMNEDGRMERVDFSVVLVCMGHLLYRRCQYRESKLYYEQCLHGEFESVHTTDRVELLANLGTVYVKTGESEKSNLHFKRALQELEKPHGRGASASAIAVDDGMTMTSLVDLLNQVKNEAPDDSTSKEAFILRHLIALNLCKELRFDEAVSIFEELKRKRLSKATSDDHFSIIEISVDKSNTYMMKGNTKTARLLYDSAVRSIRKAKVTDMHPFMTQVQRLHNMYHPSGDNVPRQFSLLFK